MKMERAEIDNCGNKHETDKITDKRFFGSQSDWEGQYPSPKQLLLKLVNSLDLWSTFGKTHKE